MHRTRRERLWCLKLAVSCWKATAGDGRLHHKWPMDHKPFIAHSIWSIHIGLRRLLIIYGITMDRENSSDLCCMGLHTHSAVSRQPFCSFPYSHFCRVCLFGFSGWELLFLKVFFVCLGFCCGFFFSSFLYFFPNCFPHKISGKRAGFNFLC